MGDFADQVGDVRLLVAGHERTGRLTLIRIVSSTSPPWRLRLVVDDHEWVSAGGHVFAALRELMAALDADQVRVAVNGARPNAWASGMLADMGSGLSVYLLPPTWTQQRPPLVRTLDPAPLLEVGTLADQDRFQHAWRSSIGQRPEQP